MGNIDGCSFAPRCPNRNTTCNPDEKMKLVEVSPEHFVDICSAKGYILMKRNVIEIENLKTYFDVSKGFIKGGKHVVKAVDDISFEIAQGKSLGLVGQSGCGKTTTARSITMLEEKTHGLIKFFDENQNKMIPIDDLSEEQIKNFRRNVQMIFQIL